MQTDKLTPWGRADHVEELASGIFLYLNASHGGIWLSPERRKKLKDIPFKNWLGSGTWFEEDCDWSLPVWFFRWEIYNKNQNQETLNLIDCARKTLINYHPESVDVLGLRKTDKPDDCPFCGQKWPCYCTFCGPNPQGVNHA